MKYYKFTSLVILIVVLSIAIGGCFALPKKIKEVAENPLSALTEIIKDNIPKEAQSEFSDIFGEDFDLGGLFGGDADFLDLFGDESDLTSLIPGVESKWDDDLMYPVPRPSADIVSFIETDGVVSASFSNFANPKLYIDQLKAVGFKDISEGSDSGFGYDYYFHGLLENTNKMIHFATQESNAIITYYFGY